MLPVPSTVTPNDQTVISDESDAVYDSSQFCHVIPLSSIMSVTYLAYHHQHNEHNEYDEQIGGYNEMNAQYGTRALNTYDEEDSRADSDISCNLAIEEGREFKEERGSRDKIFPETQDDRVRRERGSRSNRYGIEAKERDEELEIIDANSVATEVKKDVVIADNVSLYTTSVPIVSRFSHLIFLFTVLILIVAIGITLLVLIVVGYIMIKI